MESKPKKEYDLLLKSGMFWEIYPELSGDYIKDKPKWTKILRERAKTIPKTKPLKTK